jgi:thiol-disulfide isomerase/thioredoxin
MRRLLVAVLLLAAAVTGCGTGKDAVAVGGDFEFVAPGGRTEILYDPPSSRGTVGSIAGESLQHPGTTVSLDDYAGRVVVINMWGTWCPPCREELPDLQFVQDQAPRDVAVLGIDVRDSAAPARDFLRDQKITFDSIFDPAGRSLLGLDGYPRNVVPSTIVLDRRHRVAAVYLAQVRVPTLLPLVARLVAEPTSP